MARPSTGGVSRVAAQAPRPPPPCAFRSPGGAVIAYVRRRWEVAEAVSMSSSRLDGQRWRCGTGGPSPPPPNVLVVPAAIVFDCHRHRVDGPRVAYGCRRCQGGVAMAASMARASTDDLGDAARAAPRPPPNALVIPAAITFDCRQHRVDGPRVVYGRRRCQGGVAVVTSMARTSTDGLGDAALAAPCPPPRAHCSPGATITFGRRCY
jgi:hypothetical protein